MPSRINEAIASGFTQQDADNGLKMYKVYVDGVEKMELASINRVNEVRRKMMDKHGRLTEAQKKNAATIAVKYQEEAYKNSTLLTKKEYDLAEKREIELYKQSVKNQEAYSIARIKSANLAADAEATAIENAKAKALERLSAVAKKEAENQKKLDRYDAVSYQRLSKTDKLKANIAKREEALKLAQQKTDDASLKLLELQERKKAGEKVSDEEIKAAEEAKIKAEDDEQTAKDQALLANVALSAMNAVKELNKRMINEVSSAIDFIKENQTSISTRLLGTDKTYESITGLIKTNLAISPYVTQKATLENLAKLVDAGISYNVEQRAFLATISDKIATTFDAFDSNLLRLVRLQQADLTASRLGIEAALNSQLNAMFSDTSYLSNMYDTVSAALIDAESQMTREQATEFEYTIQKYLGALYSLGLSESAVSQIATGMGYLGAGNVEALSSNSQLMSLLGMSASRGGIDLGSLFTGGVTGKNANNLLRGMIEYLREIATSIDNMATKSAYGSVYGLSVSDLRALANITSADITNLYKQNMTYQSSMETLGNYMGSISSRMSISELVNNVVSNALFSAGESLAQNPVGYVSWLVTSTIKDLTGGTAISAVSGFDVNNTVEGLLQTVLIGTGLFNSIGGIVSSLFSGGGIDLGKWGGSEFTIRGNDWKGITGGVNTGVSMSAYVAGGGEDIKSNLISNAQDEAKRQSGDIDTIDIESLYYALFGENGEERKPILVEIRGMESGGVIPVSIADSETNPVYVRQTMI